MQQKREANGSGEGSEETLHQINYFQCAWCVCVVCTLCVAYSFVCILLFTYSVCWFFCSSRSFFIPFAVFSPPFAMQLQQSHCIFSEFKNFYTHDFILYVYILIFWCIVRYTFICSFFFSFLRIVQLCHGYLCWYVSERIIKITNINTQNFFLYFIWFMYDKKKWRKLKRQCTQKKNAVRTTKENKNLKQIQ